MKTLPVQYPAKVATAYVLIASIYLVFSDLLVKRLSDSVQQIGHLQTLKGWGFILVTAIALYVVLRHKWQQLQAEIAARQQAERELRRLNGELESRVAQRTADLSAAREAAEKAKKEAAAKAAAILQELKIADIHFDFDKYNLRPDAQEILKKGAPAYLKYRDYKLVVEGHCDERGTAEYNLALGEKRAMEAAKYLVNLGIEKERIRTISYGKEMPLDKGHDEAAWAKNRRAHFVVFPPVK